MVLREVPRSLTPVLAVGSPGGLTTQVVYIDKLWTFCLEWRNMIHWEVFVTCLDNDQYSSLKMKHLSRIGAWRQNGHVLESQLFRLQPNTSRGNPSYCVTKVNDESQRNACFMNPSGLII